MKICVINNRYGVFTKGGAETVIKAAIAGYEKRGDESFVITTKPYFSKPGKEKDAIYYISSLYYFFEKMPKPLRFVWHILDFINLLSFFKIYKIIHASKPDLIITHNLKGIGYTIVLIPGMLGIKHQHVLHDIQVLHPSGLLLYGQEKILDSCLARIYQYLNLFLFQHVKDVLSPSKWLVDLHKKYGFFKKSKISVMANPLTFYKQIKRAEKSADVFTFLYVGQIEDHKGVEQLLKAFLSVKNNLQSPAVSLKIIGDGSRYESYRNMYKNEKMIEFLGRKNSSSVQAAMLSSDCLLIPSICYENSPSVFFEAIVCGLPVMATRLGGNIEIIENFDGIFFKPADSMDLADKMIWAIKNPQSLCAVGVNALRKLKIRN